MMRLSAWKPNISPFLFDETDSKYDEYIVNGPSAPLEDIEKGMDGTVKHFVHVATNPDASINYNIRACDYIEDRHGNRSTLTYGFTATSADGSTEKKVTQVTDPVGRTLTFTWTNLGTITDPHYRITQVQGPSGTYRVTYDYYTNPGDPASFGNLWKVHLDPDGLDRVTTYVYGSYSDDDGTENGLLSGISDPLGHTVSYQYGRTGFLYYGAPKQPFVFANAVTEPGTNGIPVTWNIDATSFNAVYFANATVYCAPSQTGPNIGSIFSDVYTDSHGRCTGVAGERYGLPVMTYRFTYDTSSNVVGQGVTRYRWVDNNHYYGGFRWRAYASTDASATFGPHGNVLTQQTNGFPAMVTTHYYNASKYFQKASVTDALGRTTTFDYFDNADPVVGNRGNVAWVRDARSAQTGKQFTYTYNVHGQKQSETNLRDVTTTYEYGDLWGNLTRVVQDPSDAGSNYTGLNRVTLMGYDGAGRVVSSTDPQGQTASFSYNLLGQPTSAAFAATAQTPAETISYGYGANGRTDWVLDGRGTTNLTYNTGNDRVASVTDPVTGTMAYTFGPLGERRTLQMPGGRTWTYHYDGDTEQVIPVSYALPKADLNSIALSPSRITDEAGREVLLSTDGNGGLESLRYNRTIDGNGTLVGYTKTSYLQDGEDPNWQDHLNVNTRSWLTRIRTSRFTRDVRGGWSERLTSQNDYTQDVQGQRQTNTQTFLDGQNTPQSRTESYGYDTLNRLTSVNYGDGQTQGYSFDAMGNRTQKTDSATGTETYSTDPANRLLSVSSGNPNNGAYTNDANGNTLSGGGKVNTWDSQNRLVKVVKAGVTSEFTYGSDGLRKRSLVTNAAGEATQTDYVYDGQNMVAETVRHYTGGSQVGQTENVSYLQGPQGPLYRKSSLQADPKWYVYDGLGSVVGEVDVLGNLSATKAHDVYGLTRSVTGNPTSRQGFVGGLGHISDDETGLVYMRARYYDPSVGRFASEDPARSGNNWFNYCGDDPVNKVDSNGKFFKQISEAITAMAAFVAWWCGFDAMMASGFIAAITEAASAYLATQLAAAEASVAAAADPMMPDPIGSLSAYVKYNAVAVATKSAIVAGISILCSGYTLACTVALITGEEGIDGSKWILE